MVTLALLASFVLAVIAAAQGPTSTRLVAGAVILTDIALFLGVHAKGAL